MGQYLAPHPFHQAISVGAPHDMGASFWNARRGPFAVRSHLCIVATVGMMAMPDVVVSASDNHAGPGAERAYPLSTGP